MFPRLVLSGLSRGLFAPSLLQSSRAISTSVVTPFKSIYKTVDPEKRHYEAAERDLVNFPRSRIPQKEDDIAHRWAFVPQSWFDFFYNKTGVTGPYLLTFGLGAFVFSKEYFVWWVDTNQHIVLLGVFAVLGRKYIEPVMRKFSQEKHKEDMAILEGLLDKKLTVHEQSIQDEKNKQTELDAYTFVVDARKENVQLALEAAYRERIQSAYQEVKKRLDYQLALQNTKRRTEKKHMVDWIVNQVNTAITADAERQALAQCFGDLKQMATKTAQA